MDDNASIMSSIYWDAESIRSDNTIEQSDDDFNTPIGSIQDLVRQQQLEAEKAETRSNDTESTLSNEIQPQIVTNVHQTPMNFTDLDDNNNNEPFDKAQSDEIASIHLIEPIINTSIQSKSDDLDVQTVQVESFIKSEPKITFSYDVDINSSTANKSDYNNTNNNPKKSKRFKQSIARQLSSTKMKITKSLSHLHHTTKDSSKSDQNNDSNDADEKIKNDNGEPSKKSKLWMSKLRNSFRKIPKRFHSVHITGSSSNKTNNQTEESTSAVLGSDMGYFNFEEESRQMTENDVLDPLTTPDKPRRFFAPDKYIPITPGGMLVTMDDTIKQKSPRNSHKKSPNLEKKSIFIDLNCTQQILSTENKTKQKSKSSQNHGHLSDVDQQKVFIQCIKSFINTNTIQVRETLQLLNDYIGQHLDLCSENLDYVGSSKLYYLEGLQGSSDVWILTNTKTRKQFIALKKSEFSTNWTSVVNLLQQDEDEMNYPSSLNDEKIWIIYPVKIMSKLTREFNIANSHNNLLLSLLENCLTSSVTSPDGYNRTNWIILYSDISLIMLRNDSLTSQPSINLSNKSHSEIVLQTYDLIHHFTLSLHNTHAIIQASYPLDFMALLLLKLFLQYQSNKH